MILSAINYAVCSVGGSCHSRHEADDMRVILSGGVIVSLTRCDTGVASVVAFECVFGADKSVVRSSGVGIRLSNLEIRCGACLNVGFSISHTSVVALSLL